jgi:putative methionine-R-sulfoxide reductase with GAF domain
MNQINPLSMDERTASESVRRNNALRIGAAVFGATVVSLAFILYLALQSGAWQLYALVGLVVTIATVAFIATRLIRGGRFETGMWMILAGSMVVLTLVALLISGLGVVGALITITTTYVYASQTLVTRDIRRATIASVLVGILTATTDFLDLEYRLQVPVLQTFVPAIAGLVVLAAGYFGIREAWSRSFTISRKLYLAFGILLTFGLVTTFSGIYGLGRVQDAYQRTLEGGVRIQNLSDHLNNSMLDARRSEADFLLRWQIEGIDSAYNNYATLNLQDTAEMKKTLEELRELAPVVGRENLIDYSQNEYETDLSILYQELISYELSFDTTVDLIEQRGHVDTGLEGEFRDAVHNIEEKLYDREGLEKLVITMLQIRRREKDYLLRGDQEYVNNVHNLVAQLKTQVNASEALEPAEKMEINELADDYLIKFDGLVNVDKRILSATDDLRASSSDIQAVTARLESVGEKLAAHDIETAQANTSQSFIATGGIALFALLISIALAVYLSGQLTRSILQLTSTAQEISTGKFDVQAQVTSGDEIGTLAQTFNLMTSQLGRAFEDIRRRAAELATVSDVSTATSTILESKRLLQEVVDLTKERFNLYHSHIYLLDEKGENLVLAAGAGEPGRIMAAEKRSIPLNREQSLVARAAREKRGVTVNDVTQTPDFLPNPLLPDTRSELAVPMIIGENLIGVFDIQSDQVGRFTDSDVSIQTTLAAQLATSIQNVRSFEQSKKQAEFEAMVNTISQKIQRAATIEDTLQTAVRELGTAIGAARVKANLQAAVQADSDSASRS